MEPIVLSVRTGSVRFRRVTRTHVLTNDVPSINMLFIALCLFLSPAHNASAILRWSAVSLPEY